MSASWPGPVHHVQDRLFGGVGEIVRDRLGGVGIRIGRGQAAHIPLKRAYRRGIIPRIAGDIELRRGIAFQAEWGGVVLLGGQQAGDVAAQLAERARRIGARDVGCHRGAGHLGAIAALRRGLDRPADVRAHLVVALVRTHQEQRVLRGDAVRGQALEERPEGVVVVLRLRDVARVTAAERGRRGGAGGNAGNVLVTVDIGHVEVHYWQAGLEHVGGVGK